MGEGVLGIGEEEPGGQIEEDAGTSGDAGKDGEEDADERKTPAVVERDTRTDAGNHAGIARANDAPGCRWHGPRWGNDGGAAGGAEACFRSGWIVAMRAEHVGDLRWSDRELRDLSKVR